MTAIQFSIILPKATTKALITNTFSLQRPRILLIRKAYIKYKMQKSINRYSEYLLNEQHDIFEDFEVKPL